MCILGDIVGFNNGLIKHNYKKYTKKNFGIEYREKATDNY